MPGSALPSGTDVGLFLIRLVFNFYIEKVKAKKSANDINIDCDDDAGINEIGGSTGV